MSAADLDTELLVRRAGQGDQSAERVLFERHRGRLRRMVAIRMDNRLAARFDPSDVVQEALITASAQLPEYARARPLAFYPWLRQLAWQRLVDLHHHHFTAQKRSVTREVVIPISDESAMKLAGPWVGRSANPSEALLREELRERVHKALAQLPDIDREILVMRHLEQMSVGDIAAVLQISESAVKMRRLRAVRRFKELLSGE
jgi:RNA polymerase sigma-70 factor (ECF subfamily)